MTVMPFAAPAQVRSQRADTDLVDTVNGLLEQIEAYQRRNRVKAAYYEGRQRVQELGIAIPPGLSRVETIVGWPGTAIDVLDERLDWQGWVQPDGDLGLAEVYQANSLDVDAGLGHLDAFVYGTSFVMVGAGRESDEPHPLVTVESARDMTGVWDVRSRRLAQALLRARDPDSDEVVGATLLTPNETVELARQSPGAPWFVVDVDEHRLGRVPVAQIVNRPRAGHAWGRSEISRAVRGYTDAAVRTLLGMEVHREFYSAPQRYVLGAAEDAFVDQAGNPVPGWQTVMGRVLGLDRDPDTDELPQVGQFPQTVPGPYLDQVRGLAQLFAAEVAIPATYLGFASDQAASADAIRAMEARLVKRAERRQLMFGKAWLEVARLCLLVREGAVPDEFDAVSVKWRDAATPTRSAAADEATKLVAAGILLPDSAVTYDRVGLSPVEQRQLAADKRRDQARQRVADLATAAQSARQDQQVAELNSRRGQQPATMEQEPGGEPA